MSDGAVRIVEVGPRDGLQNVAQVVPTAVKVAFIEALADAGLPVIEAGSFVSPKAVPQMADSGDVLRALKAREDARYPVLVPNEKGLDLALAAGAKEIAVFTAASDAFNQRNVGATHDQAMERFRPVARRALEQGLTLRGYVSTAFGCPFQGEVPEDDVRRVVRDLFELGCAEVSVGDTIGVADTDQVKRLSGALVAELGAGSLALHLHDTWGRALANVVAGLEAGIRIFDASAGGLGGCPFAPGATGNAATEDLVALFDRLGLITGVDLERLADAGIALQQATGLALPSRALAAVRARRARAGC